MYSIAETKKTLQKRVERERKLNKRADDLTSDQGQTERCTPRSKTKLMLTKAGRKYPL